MTMIKIKKENLRIGEVNFFVGIPVGNNKFGSEDYVSYGVVPMTEDKDIVQLVPEFEGEIIEVNKSYDLPNGKQIYICNGHVDFEFTIW